MNCGAARPLVLVLEGINDCEFLFRLSQRLHAENPQITDLTHCTPPAESCWSPLAAAISTSGRCALPR